MTYMSEREKLLLTVNKWRISFLTVAILGAATVYYKTTTDHRPIGLLASAILFIIPMAILALIGFDFGKELGRGRGHQEGYASGYREGEYTIDLLRKQLKERERHLVLIESLGSSSPQNAVVTTGDEVQSPRAQNVVLPHGRNMQLALAVQDQFWNLDRFDPSDTDTWPSQKDIIEFIKAQASGISNAEAAAIERTACPVKR